MLAVADCLPVVVQEKACQPATVSATGDRFSAIQPDGFLDCYHWPDPRHHGGRADADCKLGHKISWRCSFSTCRCLIRRLWVLRSHTPPLAAGRRPGAKREQANMNWNRLAGQLRPAARYHLGSHGWDVSPMTCRWPFPGHHAGDRLQAGVLIGSSSISLSHFMRHLVRITVWNWLCLKSLHIDRTYFGNCGTFVAQHRFSVQDSRPFITLITRQGDHSR